VTRLFSVVLFLAFAAVQTHAQSGDYHLTGDPAAVLYRQSVWAHGYIHGYEAGYSAGDLDRQMGRLERSPEKSRLSRSLKRAYRPQYGDRTTFRYGYVNGFTAGCADAFEGREFRAAKQARLLAEGISNQVVVAKGEFDESFAQGYAQGLQAGVSGVQGGGRGPEVRCSDANASGNSGPRCNALQLGFELGYNDGPLTTHGPESSRTANLWH